MLKRSQKNMNSVFDIKLDQGLSSFWRTAMYGAVIVFISCIAYFAQKNGFEGFTITSVFTLIIYAITLFLFWVGDLGILNLSGVIRQNSTRGHTLNDLARKYRLSDIFLISLHAIILICMATAAVFQPRLYFYLSLSLAGVNGIWLVTKVFQYDYSIPYLATEIRLKTVLCRDSMLRWTAMNSAYSAIMAGILFSNLKELEFAIVTIGLTAFRSLIDFGLCRKFYLEILDEEFRREQLVAEFNGNNANKPQQTN